MTTYTEVKHTTKSNADYIQMAIEKLVETCDWVSADDSNILIFKSGHDFVAIPDIYYDEGTEFYTTLDISVTLTANSKGDYIAVVAE